MTFKLDVVHHSKIKLSGVYISEFLCIFREILRYIILCVIIELIAFFIPYDKMTGDFIRHFYVYHSKLFILVYSYLVIIYQYIFIFALTAFTVLCFLAPALFVLFAFLVLFALLFFAIFLFALLRLAFGDIRRK